MYYVTELTKEMMEQYPAGTKAEKNVWQDEAGNRIKCRPNDRPMGILLFPCYPEWRITGHTYKPYSLTDEWSQAANAAMAEESRNNFQNGQR